MCSLVSCRPYHADLFANWICQYAGDASAGFLVEKVIVARLLVHGATILATQIVSTTLGRTQDKRYGTTFAAILAA